MTATIGRLARVVAAACLLSLALWAGVAISQAPAAIGPQSPRVSAAVPSDLDGFVRALASVGIGTYRPGSDRPLRPVRSPRSPVRLSVDQAQAAAASAVSKIGLSGARLDAIAPPTRLGAGVSLPVGAVVAGWVTAVQSPAAELARQIMGSFPATGYRATVFPTAVLILFSSDTALHLGGPLTAQRATSREARVERPCTAALTAIDSTIKDVFDTLDRYTDLPGAVRRIAPHNFLGTILTGVATALSLPVKVFTAGARVLVVKTVRVPVEVITKAVAGVAAAVAVVGQIAAFAVPWRAELTAVPNPISKGVAAGERGTLDLRVTAPLGGDRWPAAVRNCAKALGNIDLPDVTPRGGKVTWDVTAQDPAPLLIRVRADDALSQAGTAQLVFETTTETPDDAVGVTEIGAVVAIARVQRPDLRRLLDAVQDQVVGLVPDALAVGRPALRRALAGPVNAATAKIVTLRDVEAATTVAVRYHRRLALRSPCELVTQAEAKSASGHPANPSVVTLSTGLFVFAAGTLTDCVFVDPNGFFEGLGSDRGRRASSASPSPTFPATRTMSSTGVRPPPRRRSRARWPTSVTTTSTSRIPMGLRPRDPAREPGPRRQRPHRQRPRAGDPARPPRAQPPLTGQERLIRHPASS